MQYRLNTSLNLALAALALGTLVASVGACGKEIKYEPKPAYSGKKPNLPSVPNLPKKPIKDGDVYTVWGASYSLRSPFEQVKVMGSTIEVKGVVGKVNYDEFPECAVHKTGKGDPAGCKAPIPTFWLCESADAKEADCIRVMGWASNPANVHDAIKMYEKRSTKDDEFWEDVNGGVNVPKPLPQKGAEVTVKGKYSVSYQGITSTASDPIMGILTYKEMKTTKAVEGEIKLPGMK